VEADNTQVDMLIAKLLFSSRSSPLCSAVTPWAHTFLIPAEVITLKILQTLWEIGQMTFHMTKECRGQYSGLGCK
jgi:hypothetical protein